MKFTSARIVEETCYAMRLAEFQRSRNRALIDSLAGGAPPYTQQEAEQNGIEVNTNDLSLTRLAHEARQQLYKAFFTPASFFTCRTDMGPVHKRQERGAIVTKEINRVMKKSLPYFETSRSKFALDILHGIGPSCWNTKEKWCPDPLDIGDVLIPTGTLLTFSNLPFLAIYRAYTAAELDRLTSGPKVDPGWNIPVVKKAIKWCEEETARLMGSNWNDYWNPEKQTERFRENAGFYATDIVQKIACLDFFYWDDSGKEEGWRRKIVLDAWGGYSDGGTMPDKNILGGRDEFLYNGGNRVYASQLGEIVHFQFADLAAKAPFTYHGVRSLGFLLYSVCHLQNRLRCSFNEAVFEGLLMYMRVKSGDEAERALKIQLAHRGIIDPSVEFLSPAERWQPNEKLAELGLRENDSIIRANSGSYTENMFPQDKTERTRFEVQAQVNAMTALVSSALEQAYKYQTFEYNEIFRRFTRPNSRDPDVREFRVRCLTRGIPEKMLTPEAWDLEPERVMGSGNKTLEMAIAQQLMEWRAAFGPEAQQTILHDAVLAITDDAAKARALVPEGKHVSDARHDAMLAFGSLMFGAEVQFRPDQNAIDITETLLGEMALKIGQISRMGNMTSPQEVLGLQNVGTHIGKLIEQIGQDKPEQERAKRYGQALGKLMNEVKGFAQRLQEQMAQQNGDSGVDEETKAKIEALLITAKAKAANTRESHAQRSAQKMAQWEIEQKRADEEHALKMQRELQRQQVEDAATDIKTAAEIKRERAKAAAEPKKTDA